LFGIIDNGQALSIEWFLHDHQASVRQIQGYTIDTNTGSDPVSLHYNYYGSSILTDASPSNFGFRGAYQLTLDTTSSLSTYFFDGRFYEPATGVFWQPDMAASNPNQAYTLTSDSTVTSIPFVIPLHEPQPSIFDAIAYLGIDQSSIPLPISEDTPLTKLLQQFETESQSMIALHHNWNSYTVNYQMLPPYSFVPHIFPAYSHCVNTSNLSLVSGELQVMDMVTATAQWGSVAMNTNPLANGNCITNPQSMLPEAVVPNGFADLTIYPPANLQTLATQVTRLETQYKPVLLDIPATINDVMLWQSISQSPSLLTNEVNSIFPFNNPSSFSRP
jgi:hypothetical protein